MKDNIGFLFLIIILFFFLPFSYFLFLVYLLATKNQQRRRMERVVGGSEIDQEKQRNYKTIPAARKSQCDNNYIFIAALSLAAEGFGMVFLLLSSVGLFLLLSLFFLLSIFFFENKLTEGRRERRWKRKSFVIAGKSSLFFGFNMFFGEDFLTSDKRFLIPFLSFPPPLPIKTHRR